MVRVFRSNAGALSWAAWFTRNVSREVNLADIDDEKWLGCEPDSVYFEREDACNPRPLYIAYHTDRADWANVVADAVRKVLSVAGNTIQSDFRQDYGDGSYEIEITTEAAKVAISREY